MVQAGLGADYAQQIIMTEIDNFLSRAEGGPVSPVNLVVRIAFNPNVETAWFTSIMGIINSVTMLAIILAGAAIVREREHGTMDHLLGHAADTVRDRHVKDLGERARHRHRGRAVALFRGARACFSIPIAGSVPLFLCRRRDLPVLCNCGRHFARHHRALDAAARAALLCWSTCRWRCFPAAIRRSKACRHGWRQSMQASPTAHFVSFAQAILYRGAGLAVVWPQFVTVALIGGLFLGLALLRFRKVTAAAM